MKWLLSAFVILRGLRRGYRDSIDLASGTELASAARFLGHGTVTHYSALALD